MKIYFYCDGLKFEGNLNTDTKLGGAETADIQACEALAHRGHDVTMFTECDKPGIYNKVNHVNSKQFNKVATSSACDVLIMSRRHNLLNLPFKSKVNILRQHELGFINQKEALLKNLYNIDSIFTLSQFHDKQQRSVYGFNKENTWIAGNGIDLDLIGSEEFERDPNKLMYSARPERGLDVLLLKIFPRLLQHNPKLKLYITTYGFKTQSYYNLINHLKNATQSFKDNIVWLDSLEKKELYNHFKTASLYLYPTDHEENYCILMAEAMACGLPVVTRDVGTIKEVLHREAGYCLQSFDSAHNEEFQNQFTMRTIDLLSNKEEWQAMSNAGKIHAKQFDWKVNIDRWEKKLTELVKSKKQKMSVAALIPVRNDESTFLQCINSLPKNITKYICDLGSNDSTLELAKAKKCKIIKTKPEHKYNEDIKNRALREIKEDWILWIEPTEMLQGDLNKITRDNIVDGFRIKTSCVHNDKIRDYFFDNPVRLFRNNGRIKFNGMIFDRLEGYEQEAPCDLSFINTITVCDEPSYYQNQFIILEKFRQKNKDNEIANIYFCRDLVNIAEKMINTPKLQSKASEYCQTVIRLFEDKLIDGKYFDNSILIDSYTKANHMLGQGFMFEVGLNTGVMDTKLNQDHSFARFRTVSVAKKYVNRLFDKGDWMFDKYYLAGGV